MVVVFLRSLVFSRSFFLARAGQSCENSRRKLTFSQVERSNFKFFGMEEKSDKFIFTEENFRNPKLPSGLNVLDIPLVEANDVNLEGFGKLVHNPDDWTVNKKNFEIVPWPVSGWRPLDPGTGDEAGTTEGNFDVAWRGDFYYGNNLAVATNNNVYLDGLGAIPELASHDQPKGSGEQIYLWMSDYHPDGAQMFWPLKPIPFVVTLGKACHGDDITPGDMRAFYVPAGKGVYFHPGTWHNGVYISKEDSPASFLTRQGKVHARVSASWAAEFNSLIKVPLKLERHT